MTDRRRFLRMGIGLGAALASGHVGLPGDQAAADDSNTPGGKDDSLPIIDTHVHLWDLGRFRLPWLAKGSPLDRDYVLDDYRQAATGLNVVGGVYMEVDVEPSQHVAEADYVLDLCRRGEKPLLGAVIGGRPADEGFRAYLDRFRDCPEIKGVRQVLHGTATPPGTCLLKEFVRGIRLLGDRGMSFDLCLRPGELKDADRLIGSCPETSFILDHCGNPSVLETDLSEWREDVSRLSRHDNLTCKVSGIVASAAPGPWTPDDLAPIIEHVLSCFGPDRVIFGGDWPVCTRAATLRQWVEALRTIVASREESERRRLWRDNALRVYRLPS